MSAEDLAAGQVRFPHDAARLFPPERAYVPAVVRDHAFGRVRWNPGFGSDKERSGVLAFGKGKLDGLVSTGEVLNVMRSDGPVTLR